MSRLRGIVICLLALVLVAAQMVTVAQASAMALDATAAAVETPVVMDDGTMSGDCDGCGSAEAGPGLCAANCCTSCSTTAVVVPVQGTDAPVAMSVRSARLFRLSPGLAPSPHPTPPKSLVLG